MECGWGDFPPLPDDATDSDFERYRNQCNFEAAVVGTDNQLTITLLDPAEGLDLPVL